MDRDTAVKILQKLTNLKSILKPVVILSKVLTREIPVIIQQPEDCEIALGGTAVFHVEAENISSYLWQFKTESNPNWRQPTSDTRTTETLESAITTESRFNNIYRCKLTGINNEVIYTEEVRAIRLEE